MLEIERKFLVTSPDFKKESFKKTHIVQGYLNLDPERTVRIRLKGEVGFITIKGKSNTSGTTRHEWEKEIDATDAKALLNICESRKIDKFRYEVRARNHIFEVDEFLGENEGLIIAEVELNSETEKFERPAWLGKEVTGDLKYYNSNLIKNPFKKWK